MTTKAYNIDVILLADLSLKTSKISRGEEGEDDYFERDLEPLDTDDVYLPLIMRGSRSLRRPMTAGRQSASCLTL